MNPFNYHVTAHNVLVFAAMAAVAIAYTYAVSYVWARLRQRGYKLTCADCRQPAVEFGEQDDGSTVYLCDVHAALAATGPSYRYVGML